jgi:hypothetical protein
MPSPRVSGETRTRTGDTTIFRIPHGTDRRNLRTFSRVRVPGPPGVPNATAIAARRAGARCARAPLVDSVARAGAASCGLATRPERSPRLEETCSWRDPGVTQVSVRGLLCARRDRLSAGSGAHGPDAYRSAFEAEAAIATVAANVLCSGGRAAFKRSGARPLPLHGGCCTKCPKSFGT